MKWRDLLYFSKGERRALTLLLSMIAMAWIAIIGTDRYRFPARSASSANAGIRPDSSRTDSSRTLPNQTAFRPTREGGESRPGVAPIPSGRRSRPLRSASKPDFPAYPQAEKWPRGTVVELNSADSAALRKVPGIGSVFARRIIRYRELLGGFYSVEQLGEVYGIDAERYEALEAWFSADPSAIRRLPVNQLSAKELARHPYVSDRQARSIEKMTRKKGRLQGWEDLSLLEEFPAYDRQRLRHYLSFH
ncbi:helix-hairpin-helix domain-containing protein [Parabacteroides sp. ZJ-118]|uniref:ComEA family DNA-binding protein n=1 Tax=Parabacteroides sp. ZJ-118 TaxID=2709398 RepID=UPI0013EAD1A5|nr:helix-hairpin-helix domain-containing protein [Parabacteroides sp. ZJ-118]